MATYIFVGRVTSITFDVDPKKSQTSTTFTFKGTSPVDPLVNHPAEENQNGNQRTPPVDPSVNPNPSTEKSFFACSDDSASAMVIKESDSFSAKNDALSDFIIACRNEKMIIKFEPSANKANEGKKEDKVIVPESENQKIPQYTIISVKLQYS